ncbi:MAG: hypothetical protein WDW38_003385 [Sanguina aurantia]
MASTALSSDDLLKVAHEAADAGSKVVLAALNQPRTTVRKAGLDIVTATDKESEAAVVAVISAAFPGHAILGEEGGVTGPVSSDYLWAIDPIDGTVNFASGLDSFCVSVGVLRHATPLAGVVIEFVGGPVWTTRTYSASRNGGAFLNGARMSVSGIRDLADAVVATEMTENKDMWPHVSGLLKTLAQQARGVRMSGFRSCKPVQGTLDAYVHYNLKPWDVAAGVLIVEEAGGRVTTADGVAYSVFDRSLLATNDALYDKMLSISEPVTDALSEELLVDLSQWCVPAGYRVKAGAQLQ